MKKVFVTRKLLRENEEKLKELFDVSLIQMTKFTLRQKLLKDQKILTQF